MTYARNFDYLAYANHHIARTFRGRWKSCVVTMVRDDHGCSIAIAGLVAYNRYLKLATLGDMPR